jgi:acetyl-CoA C-acetyltransferase/acetyl-CoA acyltransferase
MRKVAVVGVGETKFSGPQEKTSVELFGEAATEAINESNLKPKDIQALFLGNALGDFSEGQGMVQAFAAENIGCFNIPANRYEGACASAGMAVRDAFMWVASGFYDVVLAGGTERAASMGTSLATRTFAMFSDSRYEYPAGITFPAVFAMLAHLYSAKYGVPLARLKEQMAAVSVQSYRHGMFNSKAQLHKEVNVEAVLNSFTVCSPIQLHDCCPFSDGAAALVLTSEEVARKLTSKPVYMTGVGQASAGLLSSQQDYLPRIRARELSSKQAYDMAGLGRSGEAWMKGEADIGGKVAINPSGGLKSKGHPIGATGAGQVYEVVKQLRGEVEPERQVEDAKIGLTDTLGGDGGTLVNMILQRGW